MKMRVLAAVSLFCMAGVAPGAEASRTIFTFDDAIAADQWVAIAGVPVEVGAPPEAAPGGMPSGSALHVTSAGGNGGLYAKRDAAPLDWSTVKNATFWVYRSAEAAQADDATQIEVQFVESDGKTRFWRRMDLNHTGWKQYEVPLRWCRWSTGRIPQWQNVVRIGFWCREAADFWIDDVAVVEASPGSAELTDEELRDFAFPAAGGAVNPKTVKLEKGKHATVITDHADLDAVQLAAHLDKAAEAVAADFSFLGQTPAGRLVVFSDRPTYQQFTVRTAEQLNSAAAPPTSGGFTFWGIATSYWDPQYKTLRPVYLHEFVHSYLDDALQLDNSGEWLHEGLASHYQLKFHPQENFPQIVRNGISDAGNHQPLETLLNGAKIDLAAYWQAATVVDMLLHDDAYKAKLPQLILLMREAGSTKIAPHLEPVFGKTFDQLTEDWQAFCRRSY